MDVERLKNMIAEAFDGAAEEAAKKILEEAPHKKAEEKQHPTGPDFDEWEKNAIKSKRLTGVAIAPEDYYEIQEDGTKKTHFTWDEAMEIEKKTNGKWRLPTQGEWAVLADEFGTGEDGELNSQKLQEALGLGLHGADYNDGDGVCGQGSYGYYWSRTAYPSGSYRAYSLALNSSNVYPQSYNNKGYGFSVRCVTS